MATPKLKDLDSYAQLSGPRCMTCVSEHRTFIEQAYNADYMLSVVVRYLNDQFSAGLTVNPVRRHFREGHHEQTAK